MDEAQQAKAHEEGLQEEVRAYSKLKDIGQSKEMNDFLDFLIDTAAKKMLWTFLADNVKTWDDFMRVRGEVVSYLYPIQEIRSADMMVTHLRQQLDTYYKQTGQ